jgi:hypothetical protein
VTRLRTAGLLGLVAVLAALTPVVHADPAPEPYCAPAVVHGPNRQPSSEVSDAQGCRYETGVMSGSSSIGVTRKDVAFVGRHSGGVARSSDGGRTWEQIDVPPTAEGDAHDTPHGYVHVDPVTDRVWYVSSVSAASCGGSSGAKVSWSDDLGETWQGRTIACDTYDWGRLVTGFHPDGLRKRAVYFLGVAPRGVGGQRLVYRSLDGGATWARMWNIASATTESGAGVTASDGTIYFDYAEFIGFDPVTRLTDQTYPFRPENLCRAMVAVSEDFGETWRQEAIPGSLACNELYGQQRVAVDNDGTLYALWTDDRNGQVYLVHSKDKARTWSAPINVLPPGATFNNSHANVAAGAPGHVVITSMNTSSPVNPRIAVNQGIGDWRVYLSETFDATSSTPRFETAALDPVDDPSNSTGEQPSEGDVYVTMSPSDEGWTSFSRHGLTIANVGVQTSVGRMVRP